ncbi:hypothetical protein [Streptomyces sp. TRM68367]|uniref:hypothetical protein n=1 Tax=Streptomyces sp. TRM68367 TaxID=2758415 RepID=UPI00165A3AAF|nr:hypothetical protein [Streptomyces sp. TRM68367]MBC9730971.1 hypothetical protein [Streptomyces sp. TRM68367]
MAKAPAVIGVLTEPAPPTWWKANRHKVFLILGLICGFYIGTHSSDATPKTDQPRPAHTAPADPSTGSSPSR